ncbi:MAG: pentapeptide repeat-containing protein [Caldilinea sp. CFX5]|nr:pentapeptide repeat-containing protein [Caldilinea sp. CFX5]
MAGIWLGLTVALMIFAWFFWGLKALDPNLPIHKWITKRDAVKLFGFVVLHLGIFVAIVGYNYQGTFLKGFIDTFYANLVTELISIAITVLVIDYIFELRNDEREKERILRQMASHSNDFSRDAVRLIREKSWIRDGSLNDRNFSYANLEKALLHQGVLNRVDLSGANLRNALLLDTSLIGANLHRANLQEADLTGANLHGANLKSVNLSQTIVYGTVFDKANLSLADIYDLDLSRSSLEGVNLNSARYENVKWPKGFIPEAAGAIHDEGYVWRDRAWEK